MRHGPDRAADRALRDNWYGGFDELSLLLGAPDDGRLDRRYVAAVMVVRVVDDAERPVQDWLDLCLPRGSLSRRDHRVGAFPFGDAASSRAWREPVEDWFAEVARDVHAVVAVRHAVTGHECSGSEVDEVGDGWLGLLVPGEDGALVHHPVRHW